MHDDDRDLLGPTAGDAPSPEFVEDLWDRLDAAWETRDEPVRTSPSPTSLDVAVHDQKDPPMGSNQLRMILGAAAATAIVIAGVVVISNRNDDEPTPAAPTATTVVTPNSADPTVPAATTPETAPPPTAENTPATAPPTTTIAPPNWPNEQPFDVTYIEVDAGSAVAANEEFAWVVGNDTGLLSTIDLATNTVVATSEIPDGSVRAWHAFDSVWIGNEDNSLSRFDIESDTVVATIDVGGLPWWLDSDDEAVWLATRTGDTVRIDPATNTVVARVAGVGFGGTSINADGVWVRRHSGEILRIDPTTNTVAATISMPSGNGALTASPGAVWAPLSFRGVVHRIDPGTNNVTAEIDINAAVNAETTLFDLRFVDGSIWVVFSCTAADLAVCSAGVARIDADTNEVVAVEALPWEGTWMSGGPDTAWTFSGFEVARIDP